jgi:hypothetical protein
MNRKERIAAVRASLIELSGVSVGMGNAKEVMRRYQVIMLALIDVVRDLVDAEDTLSSPESDSTK